jgi:hypothetical protein
LPPNVTVHGAWVHQVAPGSAATAAGLQPNDVIVAVDGRPIDTAASLTADIAGHDAGDRVKLSVMRPSAGGILQPTLTALLDDASATPMPGSDQAAPRSTDDQLTGAPAGPLGSVQWASFGDPNEQAFTAEVPRAGASRAASSATLRPIPRNLRSCGRSSPVMTAG